MRLDLASCVLLGDRFVGCEASTINSGLLSPAMNRGEVAAPVPYVVHLNSIRATPRANHTNGNGFSPLQRLRRT